MASNFGYTSKSTAATAPDTGVVAATYTSATITVGADGRLTAASSNPSGGAGGRTTVSGGAGINISANMAGDEVTVAVSSPWPCTAKGQIAVHTDMGITALDAGGDGEVLTADGTAESGVAWAAHPAAGVTSVVGGTGITATTAGGQVTVAADDARRFGFIRDRGVFASLTFPDQFSIALPSTAFAGVAPIYVGFVGGVTAASTNRWGLQAPVAGVYKVNLHLDVITNTDGSVANFALIETDTPGDIVVWEKTYTFENSGDSAEVRASLFLNLAANDQVYLVASSSAAGLLPFDLTPSSFSIDMEYVSPPIVF
jgi:hypothetical protein